MGMNIMNKSINGILSLLTLFALIIPVLCACNETVTAESGESLDTVETTSEYTIPVDNFDGYTYTVFTVDKSQTKLMNLSFVAESMNGEAVNDALYTRNHKIEERYNISINEETLNQWNLADAVKRSADAGDDVYDIVSFGLIFMVPQAMSGYYMDLNNILSLNLTQSYWDTSVNGSVTLRNHQYFTAGDISIYYKGNIWVYFFNKKLVNDLSLEDPYDLVKDGGWTAETHMVMTRAAVMDLDGNSMLDDADQWGLVTHSSNYSELVYAFGENFFVKDENDIPSLSMDTPSFREVFDAVLNLNYSETIQPKIYKNTQYYDIFYNNRSLFMAEILAVAEAMRSIEALEFGILPLPKFNEAQETYISSSHPTSHLTAIPVTVSDPERTGLITEALAGESTDTLTEAYYEKVVKYKFTRDEESIAMLDLILANCTVDISTGLDIGGVVSKFTSMCSSNTDNLQSMLTAQTDKVAADIEKHFGAGN